MNVTLIALEELKAIPYFNASASINERCVNCLSFYVRGEWHCWLPAGDKLHKMQMRPSEASYFGDAPERPTDQCFRLFHLMAQRSLFREMDRAYRGILNDFQNFGASLAKVKLFYETSKQKGRETARFCQTEIEYIVTVARSVYDLLQEMIAAHWERCVQCEKPRQKRKLPSSFREMVFHKNQIQTAEQLHDRFGLPREFADWYVAQSEFFLWLRKLRDKMAHGGNAAVEILFCTELGYAIQRGERHWCELYDWPKSVELTNELVPIRPLICTIISKAIHATETFADVLERTIQLPPPLFPNLQYFSRGYFDRELSEIPHVIRKSCWCATEAMS